MATTRFSMAKTFFQVLSCVPQYSARLYFLKYTVLKNFSCTDREKRGMIKEERKGGPLPCFMKGFQLDEKKKEPLYEQLYRAIRTAIEKGGLAPGSRVPSIRRGAEDWGISRAPRWKKRTQQLCVEGYLRNEPKRGLFLSRGGLGQQALAASLIEVSPLLPPFRKAAAAGAVRFWDGIGGRRPLPTVCSGKSRSARCWPTQRPLLRTAIPQGGNQFAPGVVGVYLPGAGG